MSGGYDSGTEIKSDSGQIQTSSAATLRSGSNRHRVLTAVEVTKRTNAELAEETGLTSRQVRLSIRSLKDRELVYSTLIGSTPRMWWSTAAGRRVLASMRGER